MLPIIGNSSNYIQDIKYNISNSTISSCLYFNSDLITTYIPQYSSLTTWSPPIISQSVVNNTSIITTYMMTINILGLLLWDTKLYTTEQLRTTKIKSLDIDNNTISIGLKKQQWLHML